MSKVGLGYERGWLGLYNSGSSYDVSQYMYLVERVDYGLDCFIIMSMTCLLYTTILTAESDDCRWGGTRRPSAPVRLRRCWLEAAPLLWGLIHFLSSSAVRT